MGEKSTNFKEVLSFYKGKKVFITGNTGFKGSWLTYILLSAGAKVTGYSLKPPTVLNLFTIAGLDSADGLTQIYGDIREIEALKDAYQKASPEIAFHLAAQPIVRESYSDPLNTYTTNLNGTLNLLECIRIMPCTRSFLNITTDKVYKNFEWEYGYREDDPLDGFDPYSNSKSCSELITHSYKDSFFSDGIVAISTARAGNVIGGGDFSKDRIIPDCVRTLVKAWKNGNPAVIGVRNPFSTRPYQHVLEPLFMYLTIAMKQYEDSTFAGYYNVGPDDIDCVTTGNLVSIFCNLWNERKSDLLPTLSWTDMAEENTPHEANFLKLDCSKAKSKFGWRPKWHIQEALEQTVKFMSVWMEGGDSRKELDREISTYIES